MNYRQAAADLWRHHDGDPTAPTATLVRYATMAASSHNTQPWRFRVEPNRMSILPDPGRRCPRVDPDDHHLWVSLGCAAANLLEAAGALGLKGTMSTVATSVNVDLEPAPVTRTHLFEAIPARQCTRSIYDGTTVDAEETAQLRGAGNGEGVSVIIITGASKMMEIADAVEEGNSAQIGDPEWRQELLDWIRFNERRALETGDGLYGRSSGNPDVPAWLGRLALRFALTPARQSAKDREAIRSSAGVAVFVSESDDPPHWVEAGRCYERFALASTSLGICNAFINQPVEVPHLRRQFADWLGVGDRRPDLVVRFGRGVAMPPSLRRPVDGVVERQQD